MKRFEFIRLGLLSIVAAGVGMCKLPSAEELITNPPPRRKFCYSFKVSNELLQDKEVFYSLLRDVIRDAKPPKGYKLATLEVGLASGDEFSKSDFEIGCMTVLMTFL